MKEPERDPFVELESHTFNPDSLCSQLPETNHAFESALAKEGSVGEATFLDFEKLVADDDIKQSTLDEIEQEVNKVCVALDEDSRALDDESHRAEADNWSLNVSCDSGVYNRASSRDSGPHSGECALTFSLSKHSIYF